MTEDEMAKEIAEMSDEEVKANVDKVFGDDLAKRAVQCKSWRWLAGMMSNWGRVLWVDDTHAFIWERSVTLGPMPWDAVPDLGDPATLGCLLHLVREHCGDGGAHTRRLYRYGDGEQWMCCAPSVVYPAVQTHGATEAEALVKALEMEIPND